MKALKGIIVYIGLVLMAIVLILALMVGFLFLSKNSTLFGYYFRNVSLKNCFHYECLLSMDEETPENSMVEVVNLRVLAQNYNIVVTSHQDSLKLSVSSTNDYYGFLQATVDPETKKNTAEIYPRAIVNDKTWSDGGKTLTLSILMEEPTGLFGFRKNNNLYINLPFQVGDKVVKYNLDIETGNKNIEFKTGSLVTRDSQNIETSQKLPLNVDSLVLKTKKGNAIISGIGSKINQVDETIVVDKLDISTNGGTFDFSQYKIVTVKENKLSLTSQNANYKFKKLIAEQGVEIVGDNVKFDADEVHCGQSGFLYKSTTGALRIGVLNSSNMTRFSEKEIYNYRLPSDQTMTMVYENSIFTESSDVEINEIVGKVGIVNTYGNVKIGHLSHQASITSENGNVTIKSSGYWPTSSENKAFTKTSSLIIFTTYGDINVNEYYQDGVFYSKKGSITVKSFVGENSVKGSKVDTKWADGSRYFYTDITSKDGKITATSEGNPIRIVCTGDASVNLTMSKMLKEISYKSDTAEGLLPGAFEEQIPYYVSTNNGKIEVTLPIQSYIVFVKGKNVSGEIGATTSFSAEGTQINSVSENQPKVSISGKRIFLKSNI